MQLKSGQLQLRRCQACSCNQRVGSSNSGGARLVHAIKEWAAPTQEMEAQSHLAHFCDQSDHCKNQRPGLNWLRRIVQGAPKGFLCALSRCMHQKTSYAHYCAACTKRLLMCTFALHAPEGLLCALSRCMHQKTSYVHSRTACTKRLLMCTLALHAPKGFLCALSRCMHHTDCLNKPACWSRQSLLVTRKTSRGTQHSTRMLYVALPSLRHTHAHAHTHTLHSTGTHTLQLWHATAQKYKLHSPLRHTHTHRHPLCGNGTQDCKQRLQAHGMKGP